MGPAESYHYLNQTGDASYVDGMDDVAEFQDVVHSLDVRVCVCVCVSYIRDSAALLKRPHCSGFVDFITFFTYRFYGARYHTYICIALTAVCIVVVLFVLVPLLLLFLPCSPLCSSLCFLLVLSGRRDQAGGADGNLPHRCRGAQSRERGVRGRRGELTCDQHRGEKELRYIIHIQYGRDSHVHMCTWRTEK